MGVFRRGAGWRRAIFPGVHEAMRRATNHRWLPLPALAAALAASLLPGLGLGLGQTPRARADEPAAGTPAFFAERVGPLLAARCQSCHGEDAQEGGLRLDSLAGLAAGGTSGPAIVPEIGRAHV